jgi:hypothetical protein
VFSDGFLEGQARNLNEDFPSESRPYTEDYDYLSDSDLEDDDDDPENLPCPSQHKDDRPSAQTSIEPLISPLTFATDLITI